MIRYISLTSLLIALSSIALAQGVQTAANEVAELHRKAEQGDAESQFTLALRYADGDGLKQDDAAAVRWYQNIS